MSEKNTPAARHQALILLAKDMIEAMGRVDAHHRRISIAVEEIPFGGRVVCAECFYLLRDGTSRRVTSRKHPIEEIERYPLDFRVLFQELVDFSRTRCHQPTSNSPAQGTS